MRGCFSHLLIPCLPQMSKDQLEDYRERAGKQVEVSDLMTYVIKYMMDKGIKLENTEGMIEASVFPVNYFTIKQVRVTGPTLHTMCSPPRACEHPK